MKKIATYFYCLLITSTLTHSKVVSTTVSHETKETHQSLQEILSAKISEFIEHSEHIPGLTATEFSGIKESISNAWNILAREGVLEITGTDKEVRPSFVALQGIIEHALATELQKHIKTLSGFIHTPMPATPLCTRGEISPELVDPSIATDPHRLLTVKARTTIVRDYLFQGGNLYIVYPRPGLLKRTSEQQQIYQEELAKYPSHLFDTPLNVDNIPLHLIGATYFFKDQLDNMYVFGIKMTQANNPQDTGNFGLWFGTIDQPAIEARVDSIAQFLKDNDFDFFQCVRQNK